MTTQVTVTTHDWPVEAQRVNPDTGDAIFGPERVKPHSKVNFHLSSTMGLTLRELPIEDKPLSSPPPPAPSAVLELAA